MEIAKCRLKYEIHRLRQLKLYDDTSKPVKSLSNMSDIDVDTYQSHMENVLAWLLDAEDHLNVQERSRRMSRKSKNNSTLMSVGNALQEGNRLILDNKVAESEEAEIREQMTLLNSRWEALRVAAMDRQAVLHEVLMDLQKKQLDDLNVWLNKMERVSL
ncbi:dystrophin-like protein [Apostichopus japonicus]|uniref:Dystrophin-like protein n=1 Tax=Stichopus japonicus TaxID=307972 RepID=A0A2G8KGZ2_STIJA|nr:dystrophin-like protein [Apostichopus japonicus]